MGDTAAGFDDAVAGEGDRVGAEEVEEADPAAEQNRDQVDLELVEQARGEGLLGCGGAVQTDGP